MLVHLFLTGTSHDWSPQPSSSLASSSLPLPQCQTRAYFQSLWRTALQKSMQTANQKAWALRRGGFRCHWAPRRSCHFLPTRCCCTRHIAIPPLTTSSPSQPFRHWWWREGKKKSSYKVIPIPLCGWFGQVCEQKSASTRDKTDSC